MVKVLKQDLKMLKPRIPELLPGRVLINDRRKIRKTILWNHLSYLGFTNEYPNIWHKKKPNQALDAIYTKYFSGV